MIHDESSFMMIISVFRIVMVITQLVGFDQCFITTFARQRNSSLIMGMEEEDTRGTLNRFFSGFLSFFGLRSPLRVGIEFCLSFLNCNGGIGSTFLHCAFSHYLRPNEKYDSIQPEIAESEIVRNLVLQTCIC